MPRAEIVKPDLIITGDPHAGNWQPECRTDNYFETWCRKNDWLAALQKKHLCPIVRPGDIWNQWKVDSEMLNEVMRHWEKGVSLAVPGQHDLPQHNVELQGKTGFESLVLAGKIIDVSKEVYDLGNDFVITGCAWGREPGEPVKGKKNILVWHITTWEKPFMPGQKAGDATRLLKKYKDFDLIITGDNHQTFTVADGRRKLVNAGSMTRMRSDQKDFKPCVFLWYATTGNLQQVFIPIVPEAVDDEKCKKANERKEREAARENAFIARLESQEDVAFSFDDNIDAALVGESEDVQQVVLECTGR
jgi:hypothetical protein